jgi:hypothetical protein
MSPRGKAKGQVRSVRQGRGLRRTRGGAPRLKWLVLLAVVAVCGALAALVAFFVVGGGSGGQSGPPKAAIVDHLALTFPNPAFVQEATSTLEEAGYAVDYYPGEQVTVDFYRDLGTRGYDFIVLRVHAARLRRADGTAYDEVALFTSEPYDQSRYVDEQKSKYVIRTRYSFEDEQRYFGIMPEFIESRAKGTFEGATVILMGCDGLRSQATAKAFVERGAKAFIGWDREVSSERTDQATLLLLRRLLTDKLDLQDAVTATMDEVGPDPSYESQLRYYPAEAAASGAP